MFGRFFGSTVKQEREKVEQARAFLETTRSALQEDPGYLIVCTRGTAIVSRELVSRFALQDPSEIYQLRWIDKGQMAQLRGDLAQAVERVNRDKPTRRSGAADLLLVQMWFGGSAFFHLATMRELAETRSEAANEAGDVADRFSVMLEEMAEADTDFGDYETVMQASW